MTCYISYRPQDGSDVRKRECCGTVYSTFVFTGPPFYSNTMFEAIQDARRLGMKDEKMKIKQWYGFLLER